MWWYIAIAVIVGIIIGMVFTRLVAKKPKVFGYIYVYQPKDPGEAPQLLLEPDIPVIHMRKEKYVTFIVSQK